MGNASAVKPGPMTLLKMRDVFLMIVGLRLRDLCRCSSGFDAMQLCKFTSRCSGVSGEWQRQNQIEMRR